MELENKLLTSSFYRYSVHSEITVSIPKILLGGNASKLTLFFESKEEKPTLGWVLQEPIWPDWLKSFPFWETFRNLSFVLIV